jgi:hypothetical protein
MTDKKADIKPDIHLLAIDETEFWTIPDKWKQHIERIETVFFYDAMTYVHVAEITPSYELWRFATRAVTREDCDDWTRDEIDNYVQDGIAGDDWVTYMHVGQIDALVAKRNKGDNDFTYRHYGMDDDLLGLEHVELMETLYDRFQSNWPL